jgi:SAM-dependent methyltransferase
MIDRIARGLASRARNLLDCLEGPRLERDMGGELHFWSGALTPGGYFAETMLTRLEPEGRRRAFPQEIFWVLGKMKSLESIPLLSILDVGSGPFSTLAHLQDVGRAKVRATDPLAHEYLKLMKQRDHQFPVLPEAVLAEEMEQALGAEVFDIVFFENSLDHTQSPTKSVEQACRVLKLGGALVIKAMVNEGSGESWHGLHKWNLFPWGERLLCRARFGVPRDLIKSRPLKHVLTTYSRMYDKPAFTAAYQKTG